ncbi:RmlC-like cupin domain-containing protein [Schizothecium vesticola]|uniref:RmlC-like cupin domain-containing protein n=1 Tax=Schizothecium vesticola TaxID=314040 RepID=A0AA40K8U9_9PEZI|nr:RmlC-like cupin domain-containing protein [Schizothecium vesticola]
MASLIPIIQEILPMILPSSISVTRASDIFPSPPPPAEGSPRDMSGGVRVLSRDAVVNKTDKMCVTILIVKPSSSTTIRHNGEQDAIIYATSGTGILLSSPPDNLIASTDNTSTTTSSSSFSDKPERHVLSPGDFAVIPAWTEHQIVNESDAVELHWIVTRSGPSPVEVNLTGWGGSELQEPTAAGVEGEGERQGQGPG